MQIYKIKQKREDSDPDEIHFSETKLKNVTRKEAKGSKNQKEAKRKQQLKKSTGFH